MEGMPKGVEWPRFEDDSPVQFGDKMLLNNGKTTVLNSISFYRGEFVVYTDDGDEGHEYHERLKRPPVLAADGKPIEPGQTIYGLYDGKPNVVDHIEYEGGGAPNVYYENRTWDYPDVLTHRRPFFAADGKPLEAGQTVWHVETCQECRVVSINSNPIVVDMMRNDDGRWYTGNVSAERLTHTKPEPDSWERIEDDMKKAACDYFGRINVGKPCDGCPAKGSGDCYRVKCHDVVVRCKKLAGVSE